MNELKINKIKRFLADEAMAGAVKEVLLSAFLKSRAEKDVHYLAAKSLSVEYLEDGWRDLNKYKEIEEREEKRDKNIGL